MWLRKRLRVERPSEWRSALPRLSAPCGGSKGVCCGRVARAPLCAALPVLQRAVSGADEFAGLLGAQ